MEAIKTKALDIAQRYCGMTPKDLGCETYEKMQQKMANEIMALYKKYTDDASVIIVGSGEDASIWADKIKAMGLNKKIAFIAAAHHSPLLTTKEFQTSLLSVKELPKRDIDFLSTSIVDLESLKLIETETKPDKRNKYDKPKFMGDQSVSIHVKKNGNNRKVKKRKKAKNGRSKK